MLVVEVQINPLSSKQLNKVIFFRGLVYQQALLKSIYHQVKQQQKVISTKREKIYNQQNLQLLIIKLN